MIFCRAERGTEHGYWRWRIIDNRTCWYMGEVRVGKNTLVWGGTAKPTPAKEIVVARKSWSDAELEKLINTPVQPTIISKSEPVIWDEGQLNPLDQALIDSEQTPQQRIDGAFEALGIGTKHWIEPYIGPSVSAAEGSAVAAVTEDAAATVPLRDGMEIALMLGIIVLMMLLWRGIAATFGTLGRAE